MEEKFQIQGEGWGGIVDPLEEYVEITRVEIIEEKS